MKVTVQGPNLSAAAQRKGDFHAHAADCADNKHYGYRGAKHGGEQGWTFEAASAQDVGKDVFADFLTEWEDDGMTADEAVDYAVSQVWFAPCLKDLPNKVGDTCGYSAAHAAAGVPATTTVDCGPVGTVAACEKCAAFYERMSA